MRETAPPSDRYAIIMAGGRGERFWPLSREKTPKQLLRLLGDRSLLQQAYDRVKPLVPPDHILVITNAAHARAVRQQLPDLPRGNLVAEPCGRDTCAAVALGAAIVGSRSLKAVMAVLPADHVIDGEKPFRQTLTDAFDLAARGQVIVTIGIKPTEPATGYGYIHVGDSLPPAQGTKPARTVFYKALQFVEKPHLEKAVEFVSNGHYLWNAGMFIWSFLTFTEGLTKHQPEMAQKCQGWFKVAGTNKLKAALARDYPELRKISIDFALMEKAHNVVVADGHFAWDDLGSWTALGRHLQADAEGNCVVGEWVQVDALRNLVYDARTKNRTPIAVVGLRDAIIVHTDDALLVAHKSQAQKVKELVKKLADLKQYPGLI